ncbi:hypothetical protein ABIF79_010021 [Bradyrhizobium japonicum]
MHGNFSTRREDAALDLSRVDWEIAIVADPEPEMVSQYRVTCSDRETGVFIGSAVAPPGPGGKPPVITVADVVELIGGFRIASVIVQIEAERLTRRCRRVSDAMRRWHRAGRRRALRNALAAADGERGGGRS